MEIRFQNSPKEVAGMDTADLRASFLVNANQNKDTIQLVYSHYDRVIIGHIKPVLQQLELPVEEELKADYFLERREAGIINLSGEGVVIADGVEYALSKLDCLYLGKGTRSVSFQSKDPEQPAYFFLLSVPAHQTYPNTKMSNAAATPVHLGDMLTSNKRTIYKYIHLDGIKSCQLVMGLTILEPGSVWNSVPPHTHTRRMEVYCYFDVAAKERVFHFMGEPRETRHIVMQNYDAVISAPWSMHFGCGTSNYGFIWGMAGENQLFADMDQVSVPEIL